VLLLGVRGGGQAVHERLDGAGVAAVAGIRHAGEVRLAGDLDGGQVSAETGHHPADEICPRIDVGLPVAVGQHEIPVKITAPPGADEISHPAQDGARGIRAGPGDIDPHQQFRAAAPQNAEQPPDLAEVIGRPGRHAAGATRQPEREHAERQRVTHRHGHAGRCRLAGPERRPPRGAPGHDEHAAVVVARLDVPVAG
jgi:hypothetical protein